MRKMFSALLLLLASGVCMAQVRMQTNPETGAISQLTVDGDAKNMGWLTATDGSQYEWMTEKFGWGLGYTTMIKEHESKKLLWNAPERMNEDGTEVVYRLDDITLNVTRTLAEEGHIKERYVFRNEGKSVVSLSETGIYTPFNDNYPDAHNCINYRTNTHIWTGESGAYVNALRMGGFAPHLGLMVTEGAVVHYDVWERGLHKHNSQTRGLFAMKLPEVVLRPQAEYVLEWRIFSHTGNDDFKRKILELGGVIVESDKYVYAKGEKAEVVLHAGHELERCKAKLNGVPVSVTRRGNDYIVKTTLMQEGEARVDFFYDNDKHTHALCLVHPETEKLISRRVDFIMTRQQMNDENDPRYGAYMVYDNEGDSIYPNNTPNCNPVDRDEGAERTGMGLLMARQYMLTKDKRLKESFMRHVRFVREKLQTPDYKTFSSVDKKGRNRGYNYAWTASLFFHAYKITGNKQYALDGFNTLLSLHSQFGYGFYCIEIPVILGLECLKDAGLKAEYERLLEGFKKTGDHFVANGLNYPKFEVNYEQSIVAPAVCTLLQLYSVTNDKKYLNEAERQMPVMEAFNGFQPDFHLNDIAIRHWDGYWFGKRELFGDTFPHYWSCITASAFHYYAKITGKKEYQKRAENIVRNNLCLFSSDGRGACAYLYPYRINGEKAEFYDPYANDQDWALYFYRIVNE